MEKAEYRNKAFISYRHAEEDEALAVWLQKRLERCRVPGRREPDGRFRQDAEASPRLGRIFRDVTDLGVRADLTEALRRELEESEYLIVICSPMAVRSDWIKREIRYFLHSHQPDRILPVMAQGEPEEVLPAMFGEIAGMSRHPLACDLRRRKDTGRRQKEELTRLLAALLDCPYDELINRQQRYEARRFAGFLAMVILLLSAALVYYAAGNARIRRSYRRQQVIQSESLAEQSKMALSRRLRFDAIRSALDALPAAADAGQKDKPVTSRAMLALQQAEAAYIPEGNRLLSQTGEFVAPGRIDRYEACTLGDKDYLAVVYNHQDMLLWDAGTGAVLYDSGKVAAEPAEIDSANLFFARDLLLWSRGDELTAIDVRTGTQRWQITEKINGGREFMDVAGDLVLYEDSLLMDESREEGNPGSAEEGTEETDSGATGEGTGAGDLEWMEPGAGALAMELQLRSLEDGRLLYRYRMTGQTGGGDSCHLHGARIAGDRRHLLVQEEKFRENVVYNGQTPAPVYEQEAFPEDSAHEYCLVDVELETGKERVLDRDGAWFSFWTDADGHVYTLHRDGTWGTGGRAIEARQGEGALAYSPAGGKALQMHCMDLQSAKELWGAEAESAWSSSGGTILPDLLIDGKKAFALAWGTRAEVYDQDTGERLYAFDLPGLAACWYSDETDSGAALFSVLRDGTLASYCFATGEIRLRERVFPESVAEVGIGSKGFYVLCKQDGNLASNDRIYAFGEGAGDREAVSLRDASEEKILFPGNDLYINMEYEALFTASTNGVFLTLGQRFVLIDNTDAVRAESDGAAGEAGVQVYGVDARTGDLSWKADLGQYVNYAGASEEAGVLVFRDYLADGRELARRSATGEPKPEETWRLVHAEDGRVETVRGIAENAFAGSHPEICGCAVGADALFLSVLLAEDREGDRREDTGGAGMEERKICLLRYCLTDGSIRSLPLPPELLQKTVYVNRFSISPDGRYAVCFDIKNAVMMTDWERQTVTEVELAPGMEPSCIVWREDGGEALVLTMDGEVFLLSPDGKARLLDGKKQGRVEKIGFLAGEPFLIVEDGFDIRLLVPERSMDMALPTGKDQQYEQAVSNGGIAPLWTVEDGRILLFYGREAFVFNPASVPPASETNQTSGTAPDQIEVEAFIENAAAYNPQTDTLLLMDGEEGFAVAPRYRWADLVRKGHEALGEETEQTYFGDNSAE